MTPNPLDFVPFFVVIKITPFPALDPYNAAALGPFKTDIDSISSGLISTVVLPRSYPLYAEAVEGLSSVKGTQSTINNG